MLNYLIDTSVQNTYSTAWGSVETGTSPMSMDNIQVTVGLYESPGTFVDIKYIYNSVNNEPNNVIGLLHVSDGAFKTTIEYPWGRIVDYGGVYSAFK